jgi:hypothetical protein
VSGDLLLRCVMLTLVGINIWLAWRQWRMLQRWARLNDMLLTLCINARQLRAADLRQLYRAYLAQRIGKGEP